MTALIPKTKVKTPKQEAFLVALAGPAKGDLRVAIDMADYAAGTAISDVVKPLKDDIILIAKEMLALHSVRAAMAIVDVVEDPAQIAGKEKLAAARELLDRAGIVKMEHVVVEGRVNNLFILPSNEEEPNVIEGESVAL